MVKDIIKKILIKHFLFPDWLMKYYDIVNNFCAGKFCSPMLCSDYYVIDQIAYEFTKMPYSLGGSITVKPIKKGEQPLVESDILIAPSSILEYIRHLLRYKFLELLCRNKRVLDCACGNGYGTYILSRGAREVVGIDLDNGLIKFAKKYNNTRNIRFINTSIGGLKEKCFDIIVSVETIEHINTEDVDDFIKDLKRHLRKDGVIVFTTPRVDETISYKKIDDYCHSHKREYSKKDLLDLLSKNGLKTEQYLLQKYDGSIIYQIPRKQRFPFATHKDSFVQIIVCSKIEDKKRELVS